MSKNMTRRAKVPTPELPGEVGALQVGARYLAPAEVIADDFDVVSAAQGVKDLKGAEDAIKGLRMWNAALETHAVMERKLIGNTGRANGYALKDGCVWATQADYADAIGYSPSYVTQLKSLGEAAFKGVTPQSDEWTFLISWATRAEVRKAVAESNTVKQIQTAIKPMVKSVKETRTLPTVKREPRPEGNQTADATPDAGTPDADDTTALRPLTLVDAIAGILAMVKESSDIGQVRAARPHVAGLVREVDARIRALEASGK